MDAFLIFILICFTISNIVQTVHRHYSTKILKAENELRAIENNRLSKAIDDLVLMSDIHSSADKRPMNEHEADVHLARIKANKEIEIAKARTPWRK